MIKKFEQGNCDTDGELYCRIGKYAISEAVYEAIGMPVTGRDGDIWLVSPDNHGFCQYRFQKGGSAHIRYLYADKSAVAKRLLEEALDAISAAGLKTIFTNDRKTVLMWEKYGFTAKESNRKGAFVRWEKELK